MALGRSAALLLLATGVRGQAKAAVNGLSLGGGSPVDSTGPVVSYTTDYAAAGVCDVDGVEMNTVVLGDSGVLGSGRVLALGSHEFAKGTGQNAALQKGLFTDWSFRGKATPKVVMDCDSAAADVKAFVQGLGATVVAEGLAGYSAAGGLKAKLNADGIDTLVLTFRDGKGSPPYPTDGYEAAIIDFIKGGGSVIAAGRTTSWTWNYNNGAYRQDTCRLYPGNKIFESVGLLWYCRGYTYGYQTTWKAVTDAGTLVLEKALGELAAQTPATVLTASLPAQTNLQLTVLLVCSPCSGTTAVCTDISVYDGIWQEGADVVSGPCAPTYNGPFPMKKDDGWQTCTSMLWTIWDKFPDNKLPAAPVATAAKRHPGGGYDLTNKQATATATLHPYLSGWHSTGYYAEPGVKVEVEVPAKYAGKFSTLLVGVHSDSLYKRDEWHRYPQGMSKRRGFDGAKASVKSVWGGVVWVWVDWSLITDENRNWNNRPPIQITLKNVYKMLWYDHGITTEADWDQQRTSAVAGWADMQCRTETYSIPFQSVNLDWELLYKVCEFYWDRAIGLGENEMAGNGGYWDKRSEAAVFDLQISIGYMHSGYWWAGPLSGNANTPKSVYWSGATSAHNSLWGGNWGDLHEMGHNHDCCSWTHHAADVHTNTWVCQGYHETPQYITRCQSFARGGQFDRFTDFSKGPCTYNAAGESDNGVTDNDCGFGKKLQFHTTIMSQLGFGNYKLHIRRGNHLKKKAYDGVKWYDEQGTRMNYGLSAQTKRDTRSLFWAFSYLVLDKTKYRNAVLMDKPLSYFRFDTPTDLAVELMEKKADATRTRPPRIGPGSTKTTFTSTATLGQAKPDGADAGESAVFDGTQSVLAELDTERACDGDGTAEAWVRVDAAPTANGVVLMKRGAGAGASVWRVAVTSARKVVLHTFSGGVQADNVDCGGPALTIGQWHHVAVAWAKQGIVASASGYSAVLYIDGTMYGPKPLSTAPAASADFEYVMGSGLQGALAEPAVYCSGLTPDQVGLHVHGLEYFPPWGPSGLRQEKWSQADAPGCAEDPALFVACHSQVTAWPDQGGVCQYCARKSCPDVADRSAAVNCMKLCDDPTTASSNAGGCTPNLCLNGGTCKTEAAKPGQPGGGYSCTCSGGWSGSNCEVKAPAVSTGTPTSSSVQTLSQGSTMTWGLKLGADLVNDGVVGSALDADTDYLRDFQGGEAVMKPRQGDKASVQAEGRTYTYEFQPVEVTNGVFPDDQGSTKAARKARFYYMTLALYVDSSVTALELQYETWNAVRVWVSEKLCLSKNRYSTGGWNDFSCSLQAGWNQMTIKWTEGFKWQLKTSANNPTVLWALQIPTGGKAEERFFPVPHPKRSLYPTWWTSGATQKAAGLKVTFDFERFMWFGDGEMQKPLGKIAPVGKCGDASNGLGGAADGFVLQDSTTFTTTAGIADAATKFDVCFWHPLCEAWRKVGASLEVAGAAAPCGGVPTCWEDAGSCKWKPKADGTACSAGICMEGQCAAVSTSTPGCPAANPTCQLRKELSVTQADTIELIRGVDGRFEPWGANGLPYSPTPIYASPGANGFMVAWTANDQTYTRMHQMGKLGHNVIRVSYFDSELNRVTGKPDVTVAGGSVAGFTASKDGRFCLLRWQAPNLFMQRFEPDGTLKWEITIATGVNSFKVGDSRLASLPVGGEDYYAAYHHDGKQDDSYVEVDVWGQRKTKASWCSPSYRHELAVHSDLGEIMTVCVGTAIRVKTWRKYSMSKDIHEVPTTDGMAAGDISAPVAVEDGFWLAFSASRTSSTTYNRADTLDVGLVHIKWEAGAWQVQPTVWVTGGPDNEVAPRLWPFGKPGESTDLLVGWQRDHQDAAHMTSMLGRQSYHLAMFNTDDGKGTVGLLKDDQNKEVIEEITDAAVWGVHAPGQFAWTDDDGSAGWVYSWGTGSEKWKYRSGEGCDWGPDAVCDGGVPPVRDEARTPVGDSGEAHVNIVRVKPPDFNCTDLEKKQCHNESSCEKKFGRVTCQCPMGFANKPGTPEAQWGYVGKCEDKSCAKNPSNCGTNATCTDIQHHSKPWTCTCADTHPVGDPDQECYQIYRGHKCSAQSGEALHWGGLTKLLHYGDLNTNIGSGAGANHFADDDKTLEPRLGDSGPGAQTWKPLEQANGQLGQLSGQNWYTTAFSLALYSPKAQDVVMQVEHDIAARVLFGKGWEFNAAEVYNGGAKATANVTLSFTDAGWYWLLYKFYDDFNGRSFQVDFVKPTTGATEWPMLAWCYDLPAIDECTENIDNCHSTAKCTDTPKYFECDCPAGKPGDPPSGFNGDPTKGCVPVEGEPLMPGKITKLLHYGSETYNIGGGKDAEKFAKKMAELTPVTGDAGPAAGEVWTRVERADGNLPYGGNWHSDAFSLALWSPNDQSVDVVVNCGSANSAGARVWVEGQMVFDGNTKQTVAFPLKAGWNQVVMKYYVDYNSRTFSLEVPWNTLGWWYEKPRINECLNDTTNDCHSDANCIDTPSAYECECKAGFAGDGIKECLRIEGEPLGDGLVKKTLRYHDKNDPQSWQGGGLDNKIFDACCGGDAALRPRTEEAPGAKGADWWWGKWQAPEYNGVPGNLVTTGQPNWYTDQFSWAIYSPKDQDVDLIVTASGSGGQSRVWVENQLVNEASGGSKTTKLTLKKGWHQVTGKYKASYNGRTFTALFNSSNLGWAYEIPLINECKAPDRGGCHADANCVDTAQAYYCECKNGYAGDGTTSCEKIEGQALGCGKMTKMLHYGAEDFNMGGGIDKDKFDTNGLGKIQDLRPKIGDAGYDAAQVWTKVERADGNLPYGGNWHGDAFSVAVYAPKDMTVTVTAYCQGTSASCRLWSDGQIVYSGANGDGEKNSTVSLTKGWHQWIMKYYVDYNSRTFWVNVVDPCTLGWHYEIPDDNAKCLAVTCKSQGQCREVGVCTDNSTGVCSDPPKADGAACDDGNSSTINDQCKAGTCVGTDLCAGKTCDAQGECQEQGVCVQATGLCAYTTMPNGASCDDGKTTTVDDICTNGTCSGTDKCTGVTCSALSTCHEVGICDHQTGFCSNPVRPDGALCNDTLPNTVEDVCTAGVCKGRDKCQGVFCSPPPQCHGAGACDIWTGLCVYPTLANGTFCDDGNAATIDDTCTNGFCAGKSPDEALCPSSCKPPVECAEPPTCEGPGMVCTYRDKPNGYPCDDGDAATADDRCFKGQCLGSDKCKNVICNAGGDQCKEPGICDPTTGNCTSLPRPDGAACDDGDAATSDDQCRNGVCGGADLCKAGCTAKACHAAGVCNPADGLCSYASLADGADCDFNGKQGECQSATCQPKDLCKAVTCKPKSDCHDAGVCDKDTGICSNVTRPDGSVCQTTGTCKSGACSQPPPTAAPTAAPSGSPTRAPSSAPLQPSRAPSAPPTRAPSTTPTRSPASAPSKAPSTPPSGSPRAAPTASPTSSPRNPSASPSTAPTKAPLKATAPTQNPVLPPTASPTAPPTATPSNSPSRAPSSSPANPSKAPTASPYPAPTRSPAAGPTASPSTAPSAGPQKAPTKAPLTASSPTQSPAQPTVSPSSSPQKPPSASPKAPTASPRAAASPSASPQAAASPTASPQAAAVPSKAPSASPSGSPVAAGAPTKGPAKAPTSAPQPPTTAPSAPPRSGPQPPTAAPATGFDECTERTDPCGKDLYASGGTGKPQTCVDPNPSPSSTGDFICTCGNGAKDVNGSLLSAVGGPAVCQANECLPVNPCGDDQDCYDPDTTADKRFDYTCTCKVAARGSGGIKSQRTGTRARCEVDECAALSPCGPSEVCVDVNLTASSSSQSGNASGHYDFTCACPDGSATVTGGPANCSAKGLCDSNPCGTGQECSEEAGTFVCTCVAPNFGSNTGGPVDTCLFDECSAGSLTKCAAGQICTDPNPAVMGDFNCSCLPPFNGSRIAGPADCWHNDCMYDPCGEGQKCVDDGQGHGTFFCECDNGHRSTNRRAVCVYDECKDRSETNTCELCFDPIPTPDSVSDYRCACRGEKETRVGSPCHMAAAGAEAPEEGNDDNSSYLLIAIIAGVTALLAGVGVMLLLVRRRKKARFADIAAAAEGGRSLAEMKESRLSYKQMSTPANPDFDVRHNSSSVAPITPKQGSPRGAASDDAGRTRGLSSFSHTSFRSGDATITRV
eukprot:TRINITY_DN143_c0_g1_i2.p1 TRINITY_DN143_c0_g1~~TRINITY_DN143_c0_g1_i2.p1  ORF type:complete len:4137 (+),score=1263.62 TRINITY_DN143_c0_g1_i2:87-12497(+)